MVFTPKTIIIINILKYTSVNHFILFLTNHYSNQISI